MGNSRLFFVTFAVLASGVYAVPQATAQSAKSIQLASNTSIQKASSTTTVIQPNRWACASQASLEVATVSSDVTTEKTAYVLIHRQNGKPVASEHISETDVAALRKLGCAPNTSSDAASQKHEPFVGG